MGRFFRYDYVKRKKKLGWYKMIHGLRSERSTTEPPDLLLNGHKNSTYQVQNTLFTIQSGIRNCH